MKCETIHLKDSFDFLGENGNDPLLEVYLPTCKPENRKRPCTWPAPAAATAA